MDLFLKLVQQTPVQYSGILLLRGDYDGVRLLDIGQMIFGVGRDDVVADAFLKDFP